MKLENVKDLTEQECKRLIAIGQTPTLLVALEKRLEHFKLERARGNAMSLLLQATASQRLRNAAGLIFSAAGSVEKAGLQMEIAELSMQVEALANLVKEGA